MKKLIAKQKILSWIAEFSFPIKYDSGHVSAYTCFSHDAPRVGSLVALQSAPPSKWYLSWLHEIADGGAWGSKKYLLESIEDGELGWWENVRLLTYDQSVVAEHPEWRWTDAQHRFSQRWMRLCKEERDAYVTLPMPAVFDADGFGVTLRTRTRFGLDDYCPSRHFRDWRKVTKPTMLSLYDSFVAEKPARPEKSVEVLEVHSLGGAEIAITRDRARGDTQ